ncbi:xanthotoxin 5-hydroxylase CYP82C4-like [Coffea arabica]|uniref:Xanthotoxin 5-hydroxylase CYP82C4-like n=1 Tax=Coffea arabica TaxID=13443 RepID=A0ABM4UB29_COFAR|nr:cytochrome P450 82C4-like [Coffea arabica]XP_027064847.1 cytochrome P450 82C4-like [Coffea arabica]
MDILSTILVALLLLSLLSSKSLFKHKRAKDIVQSVRNTAPEAPGALPFIGHLHHLGGQLPLARILGSMADKYGPTFSLRLGSRPAIVVSSWEMVKECFTMNDKTFASRPNTAVAKYMGNNNAIFALAPYGPYWRDVRKMVTLELLTNQRLEKLKHVRASEFDKWIRDLYSLCSKNDRPDVDVPTKVVLNEWFELLTFNLILRMLVGRPFSTSSQGNDNSEDRRLKEAIKKMLYLGGVFVFSDVIPWIEWLDIGGHIKSMKKAGKELDEVLGQWLQEHIQKAKQSHPESEAVHDFMDVMLSTIPETGEISGHKRDAIIKSTTATLIMTGSESTAETLIWALSLLLNHPNILKIAQNELDVQVGKQRWIEEADIKNLSFLQAIVKETFRLYPPGPLSGPREATEDCYLGNFFVPKGARLIVNLWKLHRDPRIWSDPLEFKPERFLNSHANISLKGQSFEYIPFSSGRRMCPAVNYGMNVVQLTLARMLQAFDIATPMGMPVDMGEGLGVALPKLKPLEVLLTPRLPVELYQKL